MVSSLGYVAYSHSHNNIYVIMFIPSSNSWHIFFVTMNRAEVGAYFLLWHIIISINSWDIMPCPYCCNAKRE